MRSLSAPPRGRMDPPPLTGARARRGTDAGAKVETGSAPAARKEAPATGAPAAVAQKAGGPRFTWLARRGRRDPAPSRMAYRMQRLWLTPFFRALARVGLPVGIVVLGLALWIGDPAQRAALFAHYETAKARIQNRPEFMISLLRIDGASPEVDAAIRAMMPVELPASSFAIDLEAMRGLILRLDAVADVQLVFGAGVMEARVTERRPAVLWRHATGLEMLDREGHRVATLTERAARPDLPLIAGTGAQRAVPEALAILSAAGPILPRTRGLVRIGERRWDLVLDRDQRILLPETDPVRAVERVIALDRAEEMLARDLAVLDMRIAERPTIRLTHDALAEFRRIRGMETAVRH